MVTNLSVEKCANAQSAYYECVNYALQKLNLDNVSMYIDAGMPFNSYCICLVTNLEYSY
jgi:hypothetical protein